MLNIVKIYLTILKIKQDIEKFAITENKWIANIARLLKALVIRSNPTFWTE